MNNVNPFSGAFYLKFDFMSIADFVEHAQSGDTISIDNVLFEFEEHRSQFVDGVRYALTHKLEEAGLYPYLHVRRVDPSFPVGDALFTREEFVDLFQNGDPYID